MKVMHISLMDFHPRVSDLIQEQKKEHRVINIILRQTQCPDASQYRIEENDSNIVVEGVKEVSNHHYDQNLRKTFDELLKKYAPDIVHIHASSGLSLLPILNTASSLGIKKILTLNDHSLIHAKQICDGEPKEENPESLQGRPNLPLQHKSQDFYRRVKYIIDQCDTIICPSPHQENLLEKLFGKNKKVISAKIFNSESKTIYKEVLNKEDRYLFFKLGHLCNSKCLYCVAGVAIEPFIDLRLIKKELEAKAADYDCIIFTGGSFSYML